MTDEHTQPEQSTQTSFDAVEHAAVQWDALDDSSSALQQNTADTKTSQTLNDSSHPASALPEPDVISTEQDQQGLATLDPLALRPRVSSIILSAVFALIFALIAGGAYWAGVHTVAGQSYEDLAVMHFGSHVPAWTGTHNLESILVVIISLIFGAIGFLVAALRKRWYLLVQLVVFCVVAFAVGHFLKPLLPRPFLIQIDSNTANSAPSGHTMLAIAAGLALVCAVPHAWRAVCTVISTLFTIFVGCSVIVDQWHRPCDVVMSIFLAGALCMIMLACTRTSGMDKPGDRVSSSSIQITATALITFGICAFAYAAYVVWQVWPGLLYSSAWVISGVSASTLAFIIGSAALVHGMVLMMRQLTAAPLTRLGLIGAPPAPPTQAKK